MMNKLLLFLLLIFSSQSFAQTYGNEWIDYNQKYYSFKIWKDGIYKIDYSTLNNAGIPLNSISPSNLQIFGFEKEQPILVVDGNDGSFDAGDYILFYGQKNNSWLDSLMYDDSSKVVNKYYPLYNDTITYFLSWNTSNSNNRIIEETDISFTSYSPSSYFFKTNYISYHSYYNIGFNIEGVSYSQYHESEGWSSGLVNALSANNFIDANIPTPYAYTAGGLNATGLAVSISGSNASSNSQYNHHLQLSYGNSNTVLHDILFLGYQQNRLDINFPASAITSNTTKIRHTFVNDLGLAADQQAVSFVELTYPHLPNLEGSNNFQVTVKNHTTQTKTRLDLTNFNASLPYAFALDNGMIKLLPIINNSGTFQVIVPNSSVSNEQDVLFLDETQFISINQVSPVNGTSTFTNFNTYNFDESYIIITNKALQSGATNYELYRQSPAGGNKNVIKVYQDELNMQFGGGVPKHAMGIRRFQHFAYNMATNIKPKHVFIIGKGVREANESHINLTTGIRQSSLSYSYCMVPAFGYPASDLLFTHHLENNGWAPLIPIGRLAAKNNNDINIYLNKVIEFEAAQDSLDPYTLQSKYWQKEILHFGGGGTTAQQNTFQTYLSQFQNQLEGPYFGGHVTSYYKDVSDPIDPVVLYNVTDKINEGISIMTYFGHAYAGGFDLNVDNPANWDNKGKYPLLVSNSCLAGNIFEPFDYNFSSSEIFTLIENKGCIAFIANPSSAFSNGLYIVSNQFFTNLSSTHYGATIGELISYTANDVFNAQFIPYTTETTMTQYGLHGDPALRINPHPKPELEINTSSVWISPYPINLSNDSIDVSIVVHNMGRSTLDTFAIEMTRGFPNNNGDSTYIKFLPGIDYNDTIVFTIPLYANIGAGINSFTFKVDQPSIIDEVYDEINNNIITKQILFDIDGILPVWPYNYAVVPNDTITLKASTLNPFASINTYKIEIDTIDTYDSPFLMHSIKTSLGGVIETNYNNWISSQTNTNSELILTDSMVYFWRVSVEDLTGNYNWVEFSFQYIKDKSGWGQDHFFQFKNNDFSNLNYDRPSRQLTYGQAGKTISCDVYGNAVVPQVYYTLWDIAGSQQEYGICTYTPAFMVCVVDHTTLTSWGSRVWDSNTNTWINPTHNFGNANDGSSCRNRVEKYFIFFQNDSTQMADMQDMILNDIPDSNYVLVYTSRYINYAEWDSHNPELYTFFQNLGSDSVAVGKPAVPYICFFKKGDLSTFEEVYADDLNDYIRFDGFMFGKDYDGYETSTLIGPSTQWNSIFWKQNALESPTTDTTRLSIFGVEVNGTETLLIDTLFTIHDSIINFNTYISAQTYPYLRLQSHQVDTVDFTPAQIDSWHVLYDHVPESALTSVNGYYLSPTDTLAEGQDLFVAFDVTNISDLPMDSLLINYWIEDDEHNIIPLPYPRQDSLRVSQIIRDTLEIQSLGLKNLNSLWVEVNPYVNAYQTDQLEQYHFNNLGQIPFYVNSDDLNPILDVTFNGYHILNGDIVSPQSEVLITLKDENQYLIMDSETDTAYFGLYLTDPNGVQKRLNFRNSLGEPLMEWVPADPSNKKFKIIYNGNFDLDGTYRLLVQGSDKSDNISGDFQYDIEFEVDHKSTITALMNYPNPFSTQTQFVFTLTGAVVPDQFTIQIITISGKVVREITIDELSSIHIGRNITDYRWDGRDEYGDILANGIYLYRVITKIDGEDIEHRDSGADQYITQGFGKMYIIR